MSSDDSPVIDAATTLGEQDRDALPAIVRLLAQEIRDELRRMNDQLATFAKGALVVTDLEHRQTSTERRDDRQDAQLDEIFQRLAALEARFT